MPVYLLCGGTGAGKTTYARQWEAAGRGVRLSIDEWMLALYGDHLPRDEFDAKMAALKAQQLELVRQLARLGLPALLDWGFWRATERQQVAQAVREFGSAPIVLWLDVTREQAAQRLAARNARAEADQYAITPAMLRDFWAVFEPPDAAAEGLEVRRVK